MQIELCQCVIYIFVSKMTYNVKAKVKGKVQYLL